MEIVYISFVVIVIFVIVFAWLGNIIYQNPTVATAERTVPSRECLPGECAISKYSGVKRCPTGPGEIMAASIEFELCSSKYICDNPSQPIPIDERGVALGGSNFCPTNVACQCLSGQYCGSNIMTYFKPYWSEVNSITKYGQFTTVKDALGNVISTPPYYISPGMGSCTIQPTLYRDKSLDVSGCLFGTLAYYPEANTITMGLTTPLACVRGKPCENLGESPVYNPSTGTIDCLYIENSVLT